MDLYQPVGNGEKCQFDVLIVTYRLYLIDNYCQYKSKYGELKECWYGNAAFEHFHHPNDGETREKTQSNTRLTRKRRINRKISRKIAK